jgi:hypothetical protein
LTQTPEQRVRLPLHDTPPSGAVWQTAPTQGWPAAQGMLHPPQFELSVLVLVQAPLHRVCPVGQVVPHLPPMQACPVMQVKPQLPQLLGSVAVVTQIPPQLVWPFGQPLLTQVPLAQIGVVPEHTVPQVPQLLGFVWGLIHVVPQRVSPEGQVLVQTLDTHVVFAPQTWPQAPQSLLLVVISTHWMPHNF